MLASACDEVDAGKPELKVLHVETGRHFFGGPQQVTWLLRGLAENGVDNRLVAVPDAVIARIAADAGIRVHTMHCAGDLDAGFVWRLWRLIGEEKPAIVHCHSRRGGDVAGGYAAKFSATPAVLTRRVDSSDPRFMAACRYWPYRRVIAISEHVASVLAADGLDAGKIELIRSAVDGASISAAPDDA